MKIAVKKLHVNINIVENVTIGAEYDFAQIAVHAELKEPLSQDYTFRLPHENGTITKIFMPDGSQVWIGDGDSSSMQNNEDLKLNLVSLATQGSTDPTIENLKEITKVYEGLLDFKQLGNEVVFSTGTSKIAFSYKKTVPKDNNGVYVFKTVVPLPDFELPSEAGTIAVLKIQLPPSVNTDKIVRKTWKPVDNQERELTAYDEFGQIELRDMWQYDPEIDVQYTR